MSSSAPAHRRPAWYTLVLVLGLLALAQAVVLYHDSFFIQPAGDDGDLVHYAQYGNEHGWTWFFSQQTGSTYFRPAKHMLSWLIGSNFSEQRALAFRLLHFAAFAAYLVVFGFWIRWLGLSIGAAVVAALVFLVHPSLPATLTSIDGYGGIIATVFIWAGTLLAIRYRESTAAVAVIGATCFAIGALFKEYIGCLIPLIAVVLIVFRSRRRLVGLTVVMIVLAVAFAGYMLARRYTMPGGEDQGTSFVAKSPRRLVENAALATAGTFFPGDTVWVYLRRDALAMGFAAVSTLAVIAVLLFGARGALRRASAPETPPPDAEGRWGDPRVVRFLIVALVLATFPCILHRKHFAEKYVAPLLLPLGLLAGVATEEYRRSRRGTRVAVALVAVGAGAASVAAVLHKNHEMRASGERAEHMARQILAQLEDGMSPAELVVAFVNEQTRDQPAYSVYVIPDPVLLSPGSYSLEWWQPGSKIRYQFAFVDTAGQAREVEADYLFVWDAADRTARRIR